MTPQNSSAITPTNLNKNSTLNNTSETSIYQPHQSSTPPISNDTTIPPNQPELLKQYLILNILYNKDPLPSLAQHIKFLEKKLTYQPIHPLIYRILSRLRNFIKNQCKTRIQKTPKQLHPNLSRCPSPTTILLD